MIEEVLIIMSSKFQKSGVFDFSVMEINKSPMCDSQA